MNVDLKNMEIRETKDGRIFAIKNLKQEIEKKGYEYVVTFKADIAGDIEAGRKHLEQLTFGLMSGFEKYGVQVKVDSTDEEMSEISKRLENEFN